MIYDRNYCRDHLLSRFDWGDRSADRSTVVDLATDHSLDRLISMVVAARSLGCGGARGGSASRARREMSTERSIDGSVCLCCSSVPPNCTPSAPPPLASPLMTSVLRFTLARSHRSALESLRFVSVCSALLARSLIPPSNLLQLEGVQRAEQQATRDALQMHRQACRTDDVAYLRIGCLRNDESR